MNVGEEMLRSSAAAVPAAKLRRIALESQGLLKRAPFGRGRKATLRGIEHLGYVQIDTISVVARAHHHVLHSRVPNYEPGHLNRLMADGEVFEYWYHAAAYLPMRDYRYALPRMEGMRNHTERWIRSRDTRLMAEVLARIEGGGSAHGAGLRYANRPHLHLVELETDQAGAGAALHAGAI